MKKYICILISCFIIFCTGCIQVDQKNTSSFSNNKYAGEEIVETDFIHDNGKYYTKDKWRGGTLSIDEAKEILFSITENNDINKHFRLESVDFYNGKCYYIFRLFEEFDNYTVTVGWYAVDVLNGNCYDTIAWVDLVPLK